MATPPSFITEQETVLDATTPKNVAASITALANDILVEVGGIESSNSGLGAVNLGTPTGGTSVTRTQRAIEDAASVNSSEARIWTAPVPSGQTFTPSFSISGAGGVLFFIGTALLFRGSDGVGAATSTNNGAGTGAPSVGITTQGDNSAVVVVVMDWTATDGATRTWLTVNGTTPTLANGFERSYARDATRCTYYAAYYPDVGAAGLKTVGLSAPNTMRYVICAVEIKGAAGAAPTAIFAKARSASFGRGPLSPLKPLQSRLVTTSKERATPKYTGVLTGLSLTELDGYPTTSAKTALSVRSKIQSTSRSPLSPLKNLLARCFGQTKQRSTAKYIGILTGLSVLELNGSPTILGKTALSAKAAAQGTALSTITAAANLIAVTARSAMISTGQGFAALIGPIFGRAAAVGKALPGLSASSSISSRSMAQGKVTPSVRGLSSLVSQVALMSKGRALAAYSSALSARAATTSQARAAISAATILLARGTAQAKAFGSMNFGVVALLTRAAAVSMGRALTVAKAQLSATSNAQAKSRGLLLGVTTLLARGAAQGKALATINFGVLALATRAAGASAGRVVAAAKAQLFAISNSQAKANGLLSATISLLARSAAKGKALGSINFGILSLITRAASIGMGRAATSAKAQLATISNSQLQARGLLSATVSLLARGAAQGKAFGNINFGIISLISRSMAKNTGRVAAAYAARLSTTSTSMSKANGLLSATTALLGRGAARSKALPSLILVKALTTLSAAQSKGRVAVAYTAQLGNVTAARLKASGTIRFAGQTASFASSTAVSFGRAALALLPPIVDPARLLVSAGKTRLLLAFGEARSRLLTSSGKARLLMAYGEGRNRLISTLGKLRLLKR